MKAEIKRLHITKHFYLTIQGSVLVFQDANEYLVVLVVSLKNKIVDIMKTLYQRPIKALEKHALNQILTLTPFSLPSD